MPEAGTGPLAGPLVVVCCQGADCVSLFDVATGDEYGTVPVGEHPVHATVVNGRVFVATMGERSVDVIDQDGEVVRVDVGVLGPSHFAVDTDRVYAACTGGDVVACIDADAMTCAGRIGVGTEPHELLVHGGRLYVGSRSDGVVTAVDLDTAAPTGELELPNAARVQGLGVDPGAELGYAIDQRNARIYAFSLDAEPTVIDSASVGANPYDVFVHEDRIYVPGRAAGTVTGLAADLSQTRTYEGFVTPTAVVSAGDDRWVVDRGAPRLRTLTGRTFDVPAGAITGHATPGGILLSHYDDDQVSLVSPDDAVHWSRSTPANPFGAVLV